MTERSNILRHLRRRRASLGRLVWGLFAFASVSAGAAPCFAMSVAAAPVEHHHAPRTSAPPGHDHAHSAAHDHAVAEPPGEHSPSSPCPHCPLSVAMADASSSSHSLCSAADDASDGGKPSVSLPLFKHVAWVTRVELSPPALEPSTAWIRHLAVDETAHSVALNLRHCVFLI
jgi:hypothetical protein